MGTIRKPYMLVQIKHIRTLDGRVWCGERIVFLSVLKTRLVLAVDDRELPIQSACFGGIRLYSVSATLTDLRFANRNSSLLARSPSQASLRYARAQNHISRPYLRSYTKSALVRHRHRRRVYSFRPLPWGHGCPSPTCAHSFCDQLILAEAWTKRLSLRSPTCWSHAERTIVRVQMMSSDETKTRMSWRVGCVFCCCGAFVRQPSRSTNDPFIITIGSETARCRRICMGALKWIGSFPVDQIAIRLVPVSSFN